MSRFDDVEGPVTWTLQERETFLVLEGRAHVDVDGAPSFDLVPGDMASLPKGAVATWTLTTPYREFWVFAAEQVVRCERCTGEAGVSRPSGVRQSGWG